MKVDWRGVVMCGLLTAGAVCAAVLGQPELGMVLAGAVAGTLLPSPLGAITGR